MSIEKVKMEVEYEFDPETRKFRVGEGFFWMEPRHFNSSVEAGMNKYLAEHPAMLLVPEKGRKIKATMRNGSQKTLEVNNAKDEYARAKNTLVVSDETYAYWMMTGPETYWSQDEFEAQFQIVAWEYVKEWSVGPGAVSDAFNAVDPMGRTQASFNNKADAEAFIAMKNKEGSERVGH